MAADLLSKPLSFLTGEGSGGIVQRRELDCLYKGVADGVKCKPLPGRFQFR